MKLKFSFLFLFFVLNLLVSAQDLRVLSSDINSITIEYRPSVKDTVNVNQSGQTFYRLNIPGTVVENSNKFGESQLLVRAINIGVPGEFGNTIQILSSSYSTLTGRYVPNPVINKDSVSFKSNYIMGDNYSNSKERELVSFGEFGLVRNLPVQSINIYPVQFDASVNSIKIYNRILFKINYAPVSTRKTSVDDSFSSLILNWSVAKNWGEQQVRLAKVANSVLMDGSWYKFETPEEGIYKIDRTFLQNMGIDVNTLDPRTLKIYGYGGTALPENLSDSDNQGLIENAITVIGQEDGKFDASDYILFYGRGIDFYEYVSGSGSIQRKRHPYSAKNYYWLTFGGITGKRIQDKVSLSVSNAYRQTTTQAFKSYEKDSINIGKSGREYFGELIDGSIRSRTFMNSLSGIVPGSQIKYKIRVAGIIDKDYLNYDVYESGTKIGSDFTPSVGDDTYAYPSVLTPTYNGNLTDERSILKIVVNSTSASIKLYLDYYEIAYMKYLRAIGDNLIVFSKDTTATINFAFTNFSSSVIQVFDVTDFKNVKSISNGNISGGEFHFQAAENKGKISKYIGVTSIGYKTPANAVKVENSNIRGSVAGSEMIVITHKDFKTQADRYSAYRSSQSPNKLSVKVFYVDEIMNEFAGGVMDPTAIRDFLKYAYDNWQIKPFYVLLFGDASYDILNTIKNNNNYVPAFETQESLYEVSAYPTDDYYARVSGNDSKPDLAIGRLTVQSIKEAEIAVDKIINYETVQSRGDWRNRITLVADDGPQGLGADDGSLHTDQSEVLANEILPKSLYQDKIYLVAYPTSYIGSGRRKPDVNKAIINSINEGTLLLNFIGHGNPELWAHEQVFVKATTIPQLKNEKYFFLTVASCDFGDYDNPEIQSSTEIMLTMKDAGCIAAFTASRIVYSQLNAVLNDSLYSNLLKKKESSLHERIGKSYFLTKQFSIDRENDEKFQLFGDPAIRLNIPTLPVTIDSINGKPSSVQSQISALSNVKIKGSVRDADGKINPINGEVVLSVFDSERSIYYAEMNTYVTQQGGLIFKGRATVSNGLFETEFIVPKDISYENKKGKIVAYVSNSQVDGVGYANNFIVGGTDQNVQNDNKGPKIEIYFDNANYESSFLVNPDFTLIAKLKDQTGLNTTGTGIGHKLEAVLNDNVTNSIDLTNNFVGDLNSGGKSGSVSYSFTKMDPGEYKIKVKAWDVFNNFSYQDAVFTVINAENGIEVRDVVNYPNPFSANTTFTFKHNYGSGINYKIKVYTIAGRLIKTIENYEVMEKFVRADWDGRDVDGNLLANGTYLYKLIVESTDGSFHDSVLGKLSIIK